MKVKPKSPEVPVTLVLVAPVPGWVRITVAFGTAAPEGSVTVPYRVAVFAWGQPSRPDKKNKLSARRKALDALLSPKKDPRSILAPLSLPFNFYLENVADSADFSLNLTA